MTTHWRIGVLRRGVMVDDRRVRLDLAVRIPDVDGILITPGTPPVLHVPPGFHGESAHDAGAPTPLAASTVPLTPTTKVRLHHGDLTLLVHAAPAVVSRKPALPKGIRTGWSATLDRRFAAILVVAVVAHTAVVVAAQLRPPPSFDFTPPPRDSFPTMVVPPTPKPPAPKFLIRLPRERPTSRPAPGPATPEPASRESIRERVRELSVAGAFTKVLDQVTRDSGLAPALDALQPIDPTALTRAPVRRRHEIGSETAAIGDIGETLGGRGEVALDPKVRIQIDFGGDTTGTTGPSPIVRNDLQSAIRRLTPRLGPCYQRALKRSGTLGGKLLVAVDVADDGAVDGVGFDGSTVHSDEVEACVEHEVRSWKLPAPGEAVVVKIPLVLVVGG